MIKLITYMIINAKNRNCINIEIKKISVIQLKSLIMLVRETGLEPA